MQEKIEILNEERDVINIITNINLFKAFMEHAEGRLKMLEEVHHQNVMKFVKSGDAVNQSKNPNKSNLQEEAKLAGISNKYGNSISDISNRAAVKYKNEVKSINEIMEKEIQNMVDVSRDQLNYNKLINLGYSKQNPTVPSKPREGGMKDSFSNMNE